MTTATRRLTRAESQERTRTRIVEAGTRLFLEQGFRVTSLEQIGEAAGFTRGAVYSNFAGKTAIGIAVIDALYAREERRLRDALDQLPDDDVAAGFTALAEWADKTLGDPAWTRLEIEVAASSAHDEEQRAATAARYARMRASAAEFAQERFGDSLPLDKDVLAVAIIGLGLGIGLQRSAEPTIPGSVWSDALRALLG